MGARFQCHDAARITLPGRLQRGRGGGHTTLAHHLAAGIDHAVVTLPIPQIQTDRVTGRLLLRDLPCYLLRFTSAILLHAGFLLCTSSAYTKGKFNSSPRVEAGLLIPSHSAVFPASTCARCTQRKSIPRRRARPARGITQDTWQPTKVGVPAAPPPLC